MSNVYRSCYENKNTNIFFKANKKDDTKANLKTCDWLSNQKSNIVKRYCKKNKGWKKYLPAGDEYPNTYSLKKEKG